jgi:hypothetical protein
VKALLQIKKSHGQVDGPLFSHQDNVVMSTHALDDILTEVLEELYEDKTKNFPMPIISKEDIVRNYQVFRSFRRSSDTREKDSRK